MENKKQTAVEFLEEKYRPKGYITAEEFAQAKEMEKEQIINTWIEATAPDNEIGLSDAPYIISQVQKAEQYYEQTYGGDK